MRGYLLYGPLGTGITSLIAAISNYLQANEYYLDITESYQSASDVAQGNCYQFHPKVWLLSLASFINKEFMMGDSDTNRNKENVFYW